MLKAIDSYQSALIFGPEDRGLSNEELKYAQRFIRIPSNPAYPSLNLAQAVAICCYELYQMHLEPFDQPISAPLPTQSEDSEQEEAASLDILEGYFQHLEAVLLQIGYLHSHTAESRMKKFRRLLNRSSPSKQEVALLRGILRQVGWAIDQRLDSQDCSQDCSQD
ncbi:MAG: TrmH family RNA methyltransferase [Leptolyngbyaceae cyanobacterium bins.59]|nr:TrmH family RNA methyltransferase [Leptolyngbyaceae cyanobacterium bins.59]